VDRDLSGSRAVLIGNSRFRPGSGIADLPAAARCVSAMTGLLTSDVCGWPRERIETMIDVAAPHQLARRIANAVKGLEDVALLYYVGHGMRTTKGQLALALGDSDGDPALLSHTAILYDTLADILSGCPAATKLVILDCCHAELANKANFVFLSGALAEAYPVDGLYFIGASKVWEKAKAPLDGELTYFTRNLIDTIEQGIPNRPEYLGLDQIFVELRGRMVRQGLPEPVESGIRDARRYPFARNTAATRTVVGSEGELTLPGGWEAGPQRASQPPGAALRALLPDATVPLETASRLSLPGKPELPGLSRRLILLLAVGGLAAGSTAASSPAEGASPDRTAQNDDAASGGGYTGGTGQPNPNSSLILTLPGPANTIKGGPLTSAAYTTVAFNPAGQIVAVGGGSGVGLWNAPHPTTPEALGAPLFSAPDSGTTTLAFSPDGRTLAIGSLGGIDLWDVSNPEQPIELCILSFKNNPALIQSVAFSPDGKLLAAVGWNIGFILLDISNLSQPAMLNQLTNHEPANAVAYSPGGKVVAVGASSGLTLWNVASPTHPTRFGAALTEGDFVSGSLQFSPDGATLAVGGPVLGVELWNVATPTRPTRWGRPLADTNGNIQLSYSPDGNTLAVGGGDISLWNVANPNDPFQEEPPQSIAKEGPSTVNAMAFNPSGKSIAVLSSTVTSQTVGNSAEIWPVPTAG
jgi:WD40 repeat protein